MTRQQQPHVKLAYVCDDDMLLMCATLPHLTKLYLEHCEHVTDQGIARLAASAAGTRLTALTLEHVSSLTDAIWPCLAHMTSLTALSLTRGIHILSYAGIRHVVELAAVSFRAAHTQRVAATPHLLVPPPSLSLHVRCAVAVSAADVSALTWLSYSPPPYPCSDIVLEARGVRK